MLPVEVVCIPAGAAPIDLTPRLAGGPSFSTAAVGGFADCTLTLVGDARRLLPYLALIRITYGGSVLYEGQIEDVRPSGSPDRLQTQANVFGLRNLLAETSVRKMWMKRDLDWTETQIGTGGVLGNSPNLGGPPSNPGKTQDIKIAIGRFDPADQSKSGMRFYGSGVAVPASFGNQVEWPIPSGLTVTNLFLTTAYTGTSFKSGGLGIGINVETSNYPSSAWSAPNPGRTYAPFAAGYTGKIFIIAENSFGSAITPAVTESVDVYDIALSGFSSLPDDGASYTGFYGGTILADLVALVPGLTVGTIETGSDFTIQAIERAVRDSILNVVQEVAGYYTREWAVWEYGTFNWLTRGLDAPDWVCDLSQVTSLEIDTTLDGITHTAYVVYTDAASGVEAEASSVATSDRNPYAKQNRAKDSIVSAGFPMTANTSAQLASVVASESGRYVPVQGTITLPATAMLARASGPRQPAAFIRGGDNIQIPGLPKSQVFAAGRDGETLFHVVSTSCDIQAGTITVQLEGQSKRTDVILARLAAVTRTLTG